LLQSPGCFAAAAEWKALFIMYGDLATKLVLDSKRTLSLDYLPPHQTELVRAVARETRDLDGEANEILNRQGHSFQPSQDPSAACAVLVQHLCMRRNKRCLLAYHRVRTDRIERMCWEGSNSTLEEGGRSSGALSPDEQEYMRKYNELLSAYKGQWIDVDLTGSLEPPKDLFVDVRVLKDAGEIQTEYGVITLTKNSQFFVRQGDVERLIQQGFLQRL